MRCRSSYRTANRNFPSKYLLLRVAVSTLVSSSRRVVDIKWNLTSLNFVAVAVVFRCTQEAFNVIHGLVIIGGHQAKLLDNILNRYRTRLCAFSCRCPFLSLQRFLDPGKHKLAFSQTNFVDSNVLS